MKKDSPIVIDLRPNGVSMQVYLMTVDHSGIYPTNCNYCSGKPWSSCYLRIQMTTHSESVLIDMNADIDGGATELRKAAKFLTAWGKKFLQQRHDESNTDAVIRALQCAGVKEIWIPKTRDYRFYSDVAWHIFNLNSARYIITRWISSMKEAADENRN